MRGKFCFDIAAIIIMLIVLVYDARHRREKNGRTKLFVFLLCMSIACAVTTVICEFLTMNTANDGTLYYIITILNSLFLNFMAPLYVLYMVYAVDMSHRLKENRKRIMVLYIPAICFIFIAFFFLLRLLTVGEDAGVVFGIEKVLNHLAFGSVLFYVTVGLVFLWINRKIINKSMRINLTIPMVLVITSTIVRIISPRIQSVLFVVAICFLLILLFNRSFAGAYDVRTGFKTQSLFANTIKRASRVEKRLHIIMADVINYDVTIQRVGYDEIEKTIAGIATLIKGSLVDFGVTGYELFYSGNGRFYISVSEKGFEKSLPVAEEIVRRVAKENSLGEVDYSLPINICHIAFPDEADDIDSILMLAEDLRKTPHSLRVLTAENLNSSKNFEIRRQMNKIIDRAINNNYFSVYYQPIYSVKHNCFASAEALIRLNDPEHGFISPGVFIPLAEKSGAIHKLGRFVLEEVCKFIASEEFKDLGVEYIEVNLSVAQCHRSNLVDEIESITQEYGVKPSQLNLEITETAACYSENRLLSNIRYLHNLGYAFSLDDFGTGYSNLIRMASLPLNIVKLDRAFVLMDEDDEKFHVVIKNMVELFRRMGLRILVEGVETLEMVEKFIDIDVDYIQGYYYSKPLPKDDYVEFLRKSLSKGLTGKID